MRFRRRRSAPQAGQPLEAAGHIVCQGFTVPISGIKLRRGLIVFTASCWGPVPAIEEGPVAIFGSDGQGICQGGILSWPEARAGELLVATVTLSMDKINEPAGS